MKLLSLYNNDKHEFLSHHGGIEIPLNLWQQKNLNPSFYRTIEELKSEVEQLQFITAYSFYRTIEELKLSSCYKLETTNYGFYRTIEELK